jgi:hypothetical protein
VSNPKKQTQLLTAPDGAQNDKTMKTKTTHTVTLTIEQLEKILSKMKANIRQEPSLSTIAVFPLALDTDYRSLVVDEERDGEQLSGYAECNPRSISMK